MLIPQKILKPKRVALLLCFPFFVISKIQPQIYLKYAATNIEFTKNKLRWFVMRNSEILSNFGEIRWLHFSRTWKLLVNNYFMFLAQISILIIAFFLTFSKEFLFFEFSPGDPPILLQHYFQKGLMFFESTV